MNDKNGKHSIAELNVDTQVIADMLTKLEPGAHIEYGTMTETIGRDVQAKARHILNSARRIVLRDKSIVTDAIQGIGIKRLENGQIAQVGTKALKHIGRTSRRAARKIACADYDKLTNEERVKSNTHLSMLGAFAAMSNSNGVKQVEAKISHENKKLPIGKTLELFMK